MRFLMLAGFEQSTQWQCGRRPELSLQNTLTSRPKEVKTSSKANQTAKATSLGCTVTDKEHFLSLPMVGRFHGWVHL